MDLKKRKPPGGRGRLSGEIVSAAGIDTFRNRPSSPKTQASLRRRARFARSVVFEEFRYRHARAIDYDGFIDRKPNQRPRLWRAAP